MKKKSPLYMKKKARHKQEPSVADSTLKTKVLLLVLSATVPPRRHSGHAFALLCRLVLLVAGVRR